MTSLGRRCSSRARLPASAPAWRARSRRRARRSASVPAVPTGWPRCSPTAGARRPTHARGPSTSATSTPRAAFAVQADDELGGIDLLVNNAGIPKRRHAFDLTPDVVEDVMRINYFSPVRLDAGVAAPAWSSAAAAASSRSRRWRHGSDRLGKRRTARRRRRSARSWSHSAVDLDGTDIRIHLVNPGIIDTELFHLPDNEPSLVRPRGVAGRGTDRRGA